MNERDTEANTKAVDSLLNFETVKYFANEEHEARRYDRVARRPMSAPRSRARRRLALLNIGQGAIIAIGLIGVMMLAGAGRRRPGTMTVGDFVLVNAYLIQLYMPLNFLGMVYRNIKQSLTDLEQMIALLEVAPEIEDRAGRAAAGRAGAARSPSTMSVSATTPRRPILRRCRFPRAAGPHRRDRRARAAPANRRSRGCCSASTTSMTGAIEIDGQDIRDVTQDSLRRAIGVVPQDTVLFNDTIYYNIAYGRPGRQPRRGRGGGAARPHPRFHRRPARRLRDHGRRARPQAVGRREAARRDRPRHPEGAARS